MISFLGLSTYWTYYLMGIILVPGIIFASYAQIKVQKTYGQFDKVQSQGGRTAKEVAEMMLRTAKCDTKIEKIGGNLTDHYNSKTNVVSLSSGVHDSTSVSAIGVAAHEVGHVLQYKNKYIPIYLRKIAIVSSNISSQLLWPLVILGLIFNFTLNSSLGMIMAWSGVIIFGLAVIANLVTLPVEYNASKRATQILEKSGILTSEETGMAKKVLNAAALTYVAALLVSILNLLRFVLSILSSSRDN